MVDSKVDAAASSAAAIAEKPSFAAKGLPDPVTMPPTPPTKVVELGASLKARPAKAKMNRAGIVPVAYRTPMSNAVEVDTADGFQFPANNGVTDTNVVNHGGPVGPNLPVQLIFWGASWNSTDATLCQQIISAAQNLIDGPFASAVDQYGLGPPSFRGAVTVTSPAPPAGYDDGTIGDLVWSCIDANIFPEPDDTGGLNYYCVLMPGGTTYTPGGALGAHSWPSDYDFPFDTDHAWVSWIGHADRDTMTRAMGHEMVETITDPEHSAWYIDDSSGSEIGDVCNTRQTWAKGVYVEGYWGKNSNACVAPQCQEVISGVVRSTDHLDIFVVGTDGGIYTAAWEAGFTGWHGWWQINAGKAAPGTSVYGVSRSLNHLDVFAVGTDLGVYTAAWEPDFTSWHGWWRLGNLTTAPGTSVHAVSHSPDRLDIFAVGSDFGIYTNGWSPATGWSGWSQIQGGIAAPGTTVFGVSRGPGKIDLFAVGSDFGTYTAAWDQASPGWRRWWRLNGGVAAPGTSVFPVSRSLDHLDVFCIGTDHGIYTAAWEPDFTDWWHGWWRLNGGVAAPGTSVFGVSRSANHLDVFATGTDHGIYTAAWEPDFTSWRGWWRLNNGVAAPGTSVFAVSRSTDHLDVFAVGSDRGTYTAAWEPDFTDWWHGWWRIQNGLTAWGM